MCFTYNYVFVLRLSPLVKGPILLTRQAIRGLPGLSKKTGGLLVQDQAQGFGACTGL
jgi:hypothetical protein